MCFENSNNGKSHLNSHSQKPVPILFTVLIDLDLVGNKFGLSVYLSNTDNNENDAKNPPLVKD